MCGLGFKVKGLEGFGSMVIGTVEDLKDSVQ